MELSLLLLLLCIFSLSLSLYVSSLSLLKCMPALPTPFSSGAGCWMQHWMFMRVNWCDRSLVAKKGPGCIRVEGHQTGEPLHHLGAPLRKEGNCAWRFIFQNISLVRPVVKFTLLFVQGSLVRQPSKKQGYPDSKMVTGLPRFMVAQKGNRRHALLRFFPKCKRTIKIRHMPGQPTQSGNQTL